MTANEADGEDDREEWARIQRGSVVGNGAGGVDGGDEEMGKSEKL